MFQPIAIGLLWTGLIGNKDLESLVLVLYVSKNTSAVGPECKAVNGHIESSSNHLI